MSKPKSRADLKEGEWIMSTNTEQRLQQQIDELMLMLTAEREARQRAEALCIQQGKQLGSITEKLLAAEYRIKASQDQEPAGYCCMSNGTPHSLSCHAIGYANEIPLFVQPPPPELAEVVRERDELRRKLAEQQARLKQIYILLREEVQIALYYGYININNCSPKSGSKLDETAKHLDRVEDLVDEILKHPTDSTELTKLLEEAKRQPVPEGWKLVPIEPKDKT